MTKKKILLTGGTGFVGREVLSKLIESNKYHVTLLSRRSIKTVEVEQVIATDITSKESLSEAFKSEIDTVIHCAARVHVMNETALDPLAEFRKINVDGTLKLAQKAIENGVKRFIFVSTIKVNGETTDKNRPFTANDIPAPIDPYGISKYEAEKALLSLAAKSNLEVVIIRPVLVYGPGVKANFESMMRWINKGVPLPLGAIKNKRSFVSIYNLVDFILACIEHPNAANEIFLVSDGEDLSLTETLGLIKKHIGSNSILLPLPEKLLTFLLIIVGKRKIADRLCESLQVDISKNEELLNWIPPNSVDSSIQKTVDFFKQASK